MTRARTVWSLGGALMLLAALASPASAQSDTCTGADLDGMDSMPIALNLSAGAMSDSFTMTGTGCAEVAGDDMVACFTPENSCSADITCFYTPAGGGTTATSLFEGTCTDTPGSCTGSTSGSGGQTLSNIALTAGTNYCVVCSNNVNATSLDLGIVATSGDCGALPVSLQQFSVGEEQQEQGEQID